MTLSGTDMGVGIAAYIFPFQFISIGFSPLLFRLRGLVVPMIRHLMNVVLVAQLRWTWKLSGDGGRHPMNAVPRVEAVLEVNCDYPRPEEGRRDVW